MPEKFVETWSHGRLELKCDRSAAADGQAEEPGFCSLIRPGPSHSLSLPPSLFSLTERTRAHTPTPRFSKCSFHVHSTHRPKIQPREYNHNLC